MFTEFFYTLKKVGFRSLPRPFSTLQKALTIGLVNSIDDFYTAARAILVKSERYFDLYDQVFATTLKERNSKTRPKWSLRKWPKHCLKSG